MSFASVEFLVLFAVSLLVLVLLGLSRNSRARKLQHVFLLIVSYVFYGWWDVRFCLLMALLTVIAWAGARLLDTRLRRAAIAVCVAVPLGILGVFKYFNFFLGSFATLLDISDFDALNIILPVGISFYTFQSMSYSIDVYRGKLPAAGFLDVALYVSFFPQLVAGPIVKAQDFIPQLSQDRRVTLSGLQQGLQIFVMGMFKKLVLADNLSVFVDDVFRAPAAFSSLTVILGVAAYALQIYFDFSGYSDMAIGSARCMGYELQHNFNLPYLAKNPTEFWKRWHISLSTWLQEYLYIPLGGNRKGSVRTYINLMLTMLLGGLWHGAQWTFVAWGALHGAALCIHKLFAKACKGRKLIFTSLAVCLNTVFVCLCWVFFRAENFGIALTVLRKLFVWSSGIQQPYTWLFAALALEAVYVLWCARRSKRARADSQKLPLAGVNAFYPQLDLNTVWGLTLFFLEIMAVVGLAYTGASPFIYFQF